MQQHDYSLQLLVLDVTYLVMLWAFAKMFALKEQFIYIATTSVYGTSGMAHVGTLMSYICDYSELCLPVCFSGASA